MFNGTTFHSHMYAVYQSINQSINLYSAEYSILAGLICTTLSVNPDNSRYFSSKRFKVSLFVLASTTNW